MLRLTNMVVFALSLLVLTSPESWAQQASGFQRAAGAARQTAAQEQPRDSSQTLPDEWADFIDWRSIGPANMGGRITALAVYEPDSRIWYAASASGGLVKTENNGQTFEHLFDDQRTVSIGDVQVCQTNPDLVWVGTGEANPRNSVSWGDGIYKSTDGGKTWKNMGLKESFQIGRIAIDPKDPETVYAGVLGRLWGPSEQRGLFKTVDGGKNWEKVLYVDDQTGVVDVHIHPRDPGIVLVATYERQRDGFDGNDPVKKYGAGSGLYRSTDGGKTFQRITEGLPSCNLGRIGLDWYHKNPNFVYAIVESEKIASVPENAGYAGLSGEDADVGARITDVSENSPAEKAGLQVDDIVLQVNGELVYSYAEFLAAMRRNVAGDEVKLLVSRDRKAENITIELEKRPRRRGRNGQPQNSEFTGTLGGQAANLQGQQGGENEHEYGGVYMSRDAGATWRRINTLNPRPMYYSQVRVDPSDRNNLYVLGTSLYRSTDGGETFTGDGGENVHPDNHAMWIDPRDGRHMILGNDGGIYVTWDRMDTWQHLNNVAIGQFYHVGIDHNRDFKVYGGLQDNGSWGAPAQTGNGGPANSDWFRVGGGDGFITHVDPTDADQVYFESQNGAMGRINFRTGERGFIRPRPPRGTRYRFNWKTPFILSPHNSRIHYSAGNYVFRSVAQGDKIQAISPEITNSSKGAGSAISESPVTPGVLYVGTTDGAVWMTRDDGQNWEEIFVQKVVDEEGPEQETETETESESGESDAGVEAENPDTAATGQSDEGSGQSSRDLSRDQPRREARPGRRRDRGAQSANEPAESSAGEPSTEDPSDVTESGMTDAEKRAADRRAAAKQRRQRRAEANAEETAPEMSGEASGEESGDPPPAAAEPVKTNPLVGRWTGTLQFDQLPDDQRGIDMVIEQDAGGTLSGTFTTPRTVTRLSDFEFDADNLKFKCRGTNDRQRVSFTGQLLDGKKIQGEVNLGTSRIGFTAEPKPADDKTGPDDPGDDGLQGSRPADSLRATLISTPVAGFVPQTDDSISGTWKATMLGDEIPEGQGEFELQLKMETAGSVGGRALSAMGELDVYEGSYNPETGVFSLKVASEEAGLDAEVSGTVKGNSMSGMVRAGDGQFEMEFTAERQQAETETAAESPAPEKSESTESAAPQVTQEAAATEAKSVTAADDDPVTGTWDGRFVAEFMQGDRAKFRMGLNKAADGTLTGWYETGQGGGDITEGKFEAESGAISFTGQSERADLDFSGTLSGNKMTGDVEIVGRSFSFEFESERSSTTFSLQGEPETKVAATGKRLADLLPGPRWVSSLEASRHNAGRVYITLDGHRSNDDEPYVLVSEDYGKTWTSIRGNLPTPAGSTRVIREDLENEDLLFLGCEFSAWVSIDRGKSWTRFGGGLPTVAVHEFAIHPTSGEIVAATHGRSLWAADISPLRQLNPETLKKELVLLKPNSVVRWRSITENGRVGLHDFRGENPDANAEIYYHVGERLQNVKLTIHDSQGNLIRAFDGDGTPGLHRIEWDLRREQAANEDAGGRRGRRAATVANGTYLVTLSAAGRDLKQLLVIEADPNQPATATSEEQLEFDRVWLGIEDDDQGIEGKVPNFH